MLFHESGIFLIIICSCSPALPHLLAERHQYNIVTCGSSNLRAMSIFNIVC
uniref:Uncharacterized protein n=1 Tax=Octopus bimaculoides TaxID=37653 RepID=A0A0L8G485_OCTBM